MSRGVKKIIVVFSVVVATILFIKPMVGIADAGNPHDHVGALYTMTNDASGNAVIMFHRTAHGLLVPGGTFSTGGLGSGSGLGNQGALILSEGGRLLFVVNPGSDEISVFRVQSNGLILVDLVSSGGEIPVSVTVDRDLLYVLNAGSEEITGFVVGSDGKLSPLANSTRPLSSVDTNPAQISFSPNGRFLVVTEKDTDTIDTWRVGRDGLALDFLPNTIASAGTTPFGFAFGKRDQLFVSEATTGSISSYLLEDNGNLQVLSPAVLTTETAACWVVVTNDGRFAYTTNAASGTVSGYRIAFDGTITLLDVDGVTGNTGNGDIDMALSNNGRFLFTLNSGDDTISAFRVHADGSLSPLPGASGLPTGANGLAAR